MKKLSLIVIRSTIALIVFCSVVTTTYAVGEYTLLTPLPGISTDANCQKDCKTNFSTYLPAAFNLAIGIAAGMAFVVITFGGIMYATSDAISGKSSGKEYIENALYGLLLVIGAYVILNTINPKILNFNFTIVPVKLADITPINVGGGTAVGMPMTQTEIDASNAIAKSMGQTPNPCTNGQTTNCVNFNGLKQNVVAAMQNLAIVCKCTIAITGGTEGGHTTGSAHNNGTALDIRSDTKLNTMIVEKSREISNRKLVACDTYVYGGGAYLWEPKGSTCKGEVASTGDHWHVRF